MRASSYKVSALVVAVAEAAVLQSSKKDGSRRRLMRDIVVVGTSRDLSSTICVCLCV